MDDYKTIYLKELLPLIDKVAIDCMMTPKSVLNYDGDGYDMAYVSRYNSDAAWNNEGVCEMARRLKEELLKND